MWQRFTERARKVILLAQEEARCMGSANVGSEHLLLGLFREAEGGAARVLKSTALDMEKLRAEVKRESASRGDLPPKSEPNLSPDSRRALQLAADEARLRKHNFIGAEHLMLAILREREGVASQVLRELGLDLEKVRAQVQEYCGPEPGDDATAERSERRVQSEREPDLANAFENLRRFIQSRIGETDSPVKQDRLKQLCSDLERLMTQVGERCGGTSEFDRLAKEVLNGVRWYKERAVNSADYAVAADIRDLLVELHDVVNRIGEIAALLEGGTRTL